MRKQQREAILALLEETYMGTETALNYSTPFELLVAVIIYVSAMYGRTCQ